MSYMIASWMMSVTTADMTNDCEENILDVNGMGHFDVIQTLCLNDRQGGTERGMFGFVWILSDAGI